jgi:hypothetical protein
MRGCALLYAATRGLIFFLKFFHSPSYLVFLFISEKKWEFHLWSEKKYFFYIGKTWFWRGGGGTFDYRLQRDLIFWSPLLLSSSNYVLSLVFLLEWNENNVLG